MSDQPLTLYVDSQFISPYALSAFVALEEKGLDYELRTLDMAAREHREAEYARTSLTGRVPTLVHGDFCLSESSAIDEYLEDGFPAPGHPPIYPSDLRARARARQLQAWLRSDFMPVREERSTEVVFLGARGAPLSPQARVAAQRLFAALERLLAPGAHHLFGQWCIADTDVSLMLQRLLRHGDEVPAPLAAYAARQWQRPSLERWLALVAGRGR